MRREITINAERLWRSHMEMAEIGATTGGGVCRLAASPEDGAARDQFAAWCLEAGLQLQIDQIGNMYARRQGRRNDLPPILIGSHLDSQPTGGRFDGAYGVLSGLEIVRSLNEHEIDTDHPIEVVNWTNEEGCRFQPACLGSEVFAGILSLEAGLSREDLDGKRLEDELRAINYLGKAPATGRQAKAYLEAHVEQGPLLEEMNLQVGIVEGSMGVNAYEVTLTGVEAHTGTTPIEARRDALLGAAKIVVAVNELARRYEPNGRASVAHMRIAPNVRGVIAGSVVITSDCRHISEEALERMTEELNEIFRREAASNRLAMETRLYWSGPPRTFDRISVSVLIDAVQELGYSYRIMRSGAGHDANPISGVLPTAMIFAPSKGGLSHNEAEYTSPEDLGAGCNVMLRAALKLATR